MRKTTFLIMLIALLIAVAGIWGALNIRALQQHQKNSANVSASLYTTGTRVIPTVKVSTSMTNCDSKHIPGSPQILLEDSVYQPLSRTCAASPLSQNKMRTSI